MHARCSRRVLDDRPKITGKIVEDQCPDFMQIEGEPDFIPCPFQISRKPLRKFTLESGRLERTGEIRYRKKGCGQGFNRSDNRKRAVTALKRLASTWHAVDDDN